MSIKTVIFDLDGTITQPYFDFDLIREEMGLTKESGPVLESMENMAPEQRQQAEKILHFHEEKAVTESKLNPGVKQTLDTIHQAGIKIGILTRNRRQNALAIANKYSLKFDTIVDREDGPVKPDAFGVLQICRQLGVKPEETLVVGDYLFDVMSAKAAGATAVLLANHKKADEFARYADFRIEKIGEILQLLNIIT
ncbi:MAG: hypothetical protein A2167_01480 [Planctomycetes bacterium RBG_13_46_10]|nr:MAG: hypothetical protein A2167_01480 [Planctomycetes bacterium RBG_13_46_10]